MKQSNTFKIIDGVFHRNCNQIMLDCQQIKDQDVQYIISRSTQHFIYLTLSMNKLTNKGAAFLPQANWEHLTYLNLNQNQIQDRGCKFISQMNCKQIQKVWICKNLIGNEGAQHISKADWKYLQQLRFGENTMTNIMTISKGNWKQLTYIFLGWNNIKIQGLKNVILFCANDLKFISLWNRQSETYLKSDLKLIILAKFFSCQQNSIRL